MTAAKTSKLPSWLNLLALLAIVSMISAIAGLQIFSSRAAAILGPTSLAADPHGNVVVVSHGKLLFVPRDGAVVEIDLAELGLPDVLSDIRYVDDGWWVADPDASAILNCNLSERRCATVVEGGERRLARRSFKFAVGESQIYVADAARHRLLVLRRDGFPVASSRGSDVALCFPNQIELIGDAIYIADTNNHRIAAIQDSAAIDVIKTELVLGQAREDSMLRKLFRGRAIPGWCEDFASALPGDGDAALDRVIDYSPRQRPRALDAATRGRIWPIAFALAPTGQWWVVVGNHNLSFGDVLVITPHIGAARVELPTGADPTSVRIVDDKVLVPDATLMRVYQFGLDGESQGDFAADRLAPLLEVVAQSKHDNLHYREISLAAIYICAVLVIVVLFLAWRAQGSTGRAHR